MMTSDNAIATTPMTYYNLHIYAGDVYSRMEIVRTKRYLKDLERLGATDAEITALEEMIAFNPTVGDAIPGLSGIRKVRFAIGGRGKKGGGRAIYFLMVSDDLAVMLYAYSKATQEDLSQAQKKAALTVLKEFKDG